MESVIENKQRKKIFSHNRSSSLFHSFSSSNTSKVNTYGKKKIHNPTLSKAQADYEQWSKIKFDEGGGGRVGLGINKLIPLEIDNNKENISWEDETTQVLRDIRSKEELDAKKAKEVVKPSKPVSVVEESPSKSSNRLSRLVRTISSLSTSSISSKDTIDAKNIRSHRISQQSSVSTIQRYSVGSNNSSTEVTPIKSHPSNVRYSTLMLDVGNLRRSSVAKNLSQILNNNNSNSSNSDIESEEEDEDDEDDEGRRNIPGIVVPFENDRRESEEIDNLNIPSNYPPLTMSSSRNSSYLPIRKPVEMMASGIPSPVSSVSSTTSTVSTASLGIPSIPSISNNNSPLLPFKRDISSFKHKKVVKTAISGPTSANHQDFFAPRPSIDSTHESIHSMGGQEHYQSRASRYGSSFINSLTPHSSLLSLRSTKAKERTLSTSSEYIPPITTTNTNSSTSTRQSKHSHKLSLVNGFTKKASIQDMKRLISFSPSSSSLFRASSNSSTTTTNNSNGNSSSSATMTKSPSIIIGDSFDKSMISLPTPVDGSREKLRNKLRASTSLLSLARSDTSGSLTVGIPIAEYEHSQLQTLLSLCSCREIEDFTQYINHGYDNLEKLAEASFSEVFIQKSKSYGSRILKIIPFGNEELDQLPVQDIIQELTIARMLMPLDGYVDVLDSTVVRGTYPRRLLQLWDKYNHENNSENYRPDFFKPDQMYCIVVMANAGVDLEHFQLTSWHDAQSIFWQIVNSLSIAEDKFDFEHRDLHWGNVVIEEMASHNVSTAANLLNNLSLADDSSLLSNEDINEKELKVTLIDYTLSRAMADDGNVVFTRLDHPDFFRGKGDYQFDIYRFMRTHVGNVSTLQPPNNPSQLSSSPVGYSPDPMNGVASTSNKQTNWSQFCPQTNVLWLHYLADKLLNSKSLPRVTTTRSGRLSFGGGSNGSLRDAYLKGHSLSHTTHNEEARSCLILETVHKTLDPRKKRFGGKKHGAPLSFQDFSSAKDVLRWGVRNKFLPNNF